MTIQSKRFTGILAGVSLLLLIPFIAMQFTREVNWSAADFIVAAVLLVGAGSLCELVLRKTRTTGRCFLLCGIVVAVLALVWIELAVGIFGTPFADN